MLLSKSPVRSISEKLKSPQASIKDMKIERKKDFRSFLKYIERESKELEKIKLPARNEVTKKSGSGGIGALLGFGALGLLGLLGGMGDKGNMYKYGDKNLGGNIFKGPYAVGRDRKGEDDDQKIDDPITDLPELPKSTSLSAKFKKAFQVGAVNATELNKEKVKISVKEQREMARESRRSRTVETEIGGDATGKKTASTTSTIDDFINAEDPFNVKPSSKPDGTPGGPTGGTKKIFPEGTERSLNSKIQRYLSPTTNATTKGRLFDEISDILRKAGFPQNKINKFFIDVLQVNPKAVDPIFKQGDLFGKFKYDKSTATSGGKSKGNKPVKISMKKGFFNRMKLDFQKPTLGINTMEGMFSKLGLGKKTNLFKANPKGMNLFKLGTFSKGKTGLFIVDVGLAAYDLYSSLRKVTPRSNIGASLLDLVGINLNNFVADMLNNPSMLREYVSVTNDPNAINANKNREIINENIRKIKEQNKKDFTGKDITKGSITGKQIIENLNPFKNPQIYNPFSTYQVKPNPDLFTKPSGDPNDDVLSIFQSAAMEAN